MLNTRNPEELALVGHKRLHHQRQPDTIDLTNDEPVVENHGFTDNFSNHDYEYEKRLMMQR